jgi:hypothetical protein
MPYIDVIKAKKRSEGRRGQRPGGPESTAAIETGSGKGIEVCGRCE